MTLFDRSQRSSYQPAIV